MRKLSILLAHLLLLSVFLPTVVLAQSTSDGAPDSDTRTADTDTESRDAKRQERLEKYKEKLQERVAERLTAAEERRITNACKAAQVKTARLVTSVSQVQEIRRGTYNKMTEKLTRLVEKVEAAGANATDLKAAVQAFGTQVDVFLDAIIEYEQTLNDLSQMNCTDDPTAFKAALVTAREQRVTLLSSAQSLRQYLNDTIKPILQTLHSQLAVNDSGSDVEPTVAQTPVTSDRQVE